jgi:hypothetical protein
MRRILRLGLPPVIAALALLASPAKASADDVSGAQSLLCSAVSATICTDDGECQTEEPWELNIPQFLEFDMKGKMMSTTKASGENRSTPMKTLERDNGSVFIQGIEQGRAFSVVISEKTGELAVALAKEGAAVSAFGACTPTPAAK